MSLRWYVRPGTVAVEPSTFVCAAGRLFGRNNIGAVVVQHAGRIVGIVTDRDLALRVVGQGLDPNTTMLRDVMTPEVATLAPTASQGDAIRLMYQRKVRRIPIVERGRLVGMVTLDDLLLDEAVPLEHLAAVVQAQLGPGGPMDARRPAYRRRGTTVELTGGAPAKEIEPDVA
ncbi:MAG TPA: CBS domain-containing protein [Gemmatimonadaceae bacterium]